MSEHARSAESSVASSGPQLAPAQTVEVNPTALYSLGSSSGERDRVERQADELAGESAASLDQLSRRPLWWIDSTLEVKLTSAQTEGHMGMWLLMATRGAASPLHVHHREDEQFLVIDGRVQFVVGDQPLEALPGDLTLLPRDLPHAFAVTSERARLIGIVTPGGFESFFTDLATPVMPGAPPAAPPTIAAMTAAAPAYGLEILGPPPRP